MALSFLARLPFALRCGNDRALDRCLAFYLEVVHQRQSDHVIFIGNTEQAQPGAVCVGNNALLNVGDRAGRALPYSRKAACGRSSLTASVELSARSTRQARSSRLTTACRRSWLRMETRSTAPCFIASRMAASSTLSFDRQGRAFPACKGVFLLDHLANGVRVGIAVENDQFQ